MINYESNFVYYSSFYTTNILYNSLVTIFNSLNIGTKRIKIY